MVNFKTLFSRVKSANLVKKTSQEKLRRAELKLLEEAAQLLYRYENAVQEAGVAGAQFAVISQVLDLHEWRVELPRDEFLNFALWVSTDLDRHAHLYWDDSELLPGYDYVREEDQILQAVIITDGIALVFCKDARTADTYVLYNSYNASDKWHPLPRVVSWKDVVEKVELWRTLEGILR